MSVSVIIPTYKPQEYLFNCLDSLCLQTLNKDQFEVIIVLNGPKNPYFDLIDSYIQTHFDIINIRTLYSDIPGVSNARNKGIDEALSKYITFIDDDDVVSKTFLEELLAKAHEDCLVISNVYGIDDTTGKAYEYLLSKEYKKIARIETPSFFTARRLLSPVWCKIIPQKVINGDRFPTDFALGEDSLFMFNISRRIKDIRITSPDAVYYVRHRNGSASRRHYSYWFRILLAFRTTFRYFFIYIRTPFSYNFPFFMTRIAATLRKLARKAYETE
jgi:glycosyltransferase involved in cell wall biosynthesis